MFMLAPIAVSKGCRTVQRTGREQGRLRLIRQLMNPIQGLEQHRG